MHTEDGAKAFVSFFVAEMGRSAYAADSTTLAAMSSPDCRGCKVLLDFADDLRAKGHHVDHESVRLAGQSVRPGSHADRQVIDVIVQDEASTIVDQAGRTVRDVPGERFTLRATVEWAGDRWVMRDNVLVLPE